MIFSLGDEVRSTREIGQKVPKGTSGTVVRIGGPHELSPFHYGVDFTGYPFYGQEKTWPVMGYEIERIA